MTILFKDEYFQEVLGLRERLAEENDYVCLGEWQCLFEVSLL